MTNLLTNDDVTVLGGPAEITVDLDFGPTGNRGSYWIVGSGNPNDSETEIGQTPQVQDMYLNLNPEEGEYLSVYQYQTGIGITSWVKLVNLIPKISSKNVLADFTTGLATINLPLVGIVPEASIGTLVATDFNIQHSVVGTDSPVSSGLSVVGITTDNGVSVLQIEVRAIQQVDGAWEEISGQQLIHLFISVV
jgi:hypothetical protein